MPDYPNNALPDKEYLHKVISTLFPAQVYDLVQEAFKKRSIAKLTPVDEMIEITPSIVNKIENLMLMPSKRNYLIFSFIAIHGRAINLLKRKSNNKRQIAKRAKFEIDIGILVDATLEDSFQTDDKNKNSNEETKDQNELGGSKMNLG